ncbi:MAG: cyclic pyranopterin monophosphate synthase MoaC [Xanthomonadales bacterium]|jgi:molybdenum cofactor biosynthesis protein MoaC|nr:cyclic pyranopterin monophosphate synthase MoaC [Xanthomonadales bacterium]
MTQHFAMADVSAKTPTRRRALARGSLLLGEEAFEAVRNGSVPKGDPLAMAEIAGIQGAKLTPQLLPLCHPISLSRVSVHHRLDDSRHAVVVYVLAEITEKTGVEMEALTGLNIALLTLWDLCKPLNAALVMDDIRLLYKSGGKQGEWTHPEGLDDTARELLDS